MRAEVECNGKKCFDTWEMANKTVKAQKRRYDRPLVAYRCLTCRSWHIGGVTKKRKKEGRLWINEALQQRE